MSGYKTLRSKGKDAFIVKKSRFIGYGCAVETEKEALAFLAEIRTKHKDATHNCFAYVVGRNEGIMRYNDDGEPSGTAGMPILEVIRARHVVNCCVVVTRYFGGILLGAGGLTRAYTEGATIALNASGIIMMEDSVRFWAGMDYTLWGRIAHYLKSAPAMLEHTEFAATVTATLLVRKWDTETVFDALTKLSNGQIDLLPIEDIVFGWDVGEELA